MKRLFPYVALIYILFLSSVDVLAQAPSITFAAPSYAYPTGTAITALTPTNNGGAVPATVYATVSTFAGSTASNTGFTNATGTAARFNTPRWTTFDAAGNQYVADATNNEIRKITPAGVVTLIAGSTSGANGTTNATGTSALFDGPYAITFDGTNLYVADFNNNQIRKVTTAGVVTLIAGNAGGGSGLTNGTGTAALFNTPAGIVYDPTNSVFYIADFANNQIRKMTPGGIVTLFAGNAAAGSGSTDGTGSAASFNGPNGIAIDASGNVYVADQNNNEIRKITPAGVVTTLAGSTTSGSADGLGTAATFLTPRGLDVDISGNVYVTDSGNDLIRMITPAGAVTTIAGSGSTAQTNGVGTAAAFNASRGVAVDPTTGNIFISDYSNNVIRKIIGTGYSISPALPAGLSFNATTGTISGNPTAVSAATDYTITAFNVSGSSSAVVTITCVRTVDWKGGTSTAWNTAGNWSTNQVPLSTDAVRIGVVTYTNNTREPSITAANVTVSSITFGSVHAASTLNVSSPRTLTINDNLTVNSSATPTITGTGNINLAPGSILKVSTVATAGVLTTTLSGKLTLQSDATGSASVGPITTSSITGSRANAIYVERYVTGGSNTYRGYRLMSSPVYQGTVASNKVYNLDYILASALITGSTGVGGGFDKTGNPTLYLFREDQAVSNSGFTTGNYWGVSKLNNALTYNLFLNGGSTNYNLSTGNGFLFFFRGDRTTNLAAKYTTTTSAESVVFTTLGTLNTGTIPVNIWYGSNLGYSTVSTGSTNAAVRGFNLVGNPYASSIDWDTFQTSTSGTGIYGVNMNSYMYVLNPVNKNYGSYDQSTGSGNNGATNIIASGQGFFVVAKSTSPTPQLVFSESAKTTAQNVGLNLWLGAPVVNANKQYFHIEMAKDTIVTDELLIGFNNSLKDQRFAENFDVPYKPGYGAVSINSKSSDNIDLALNYIPLPKQSETISLNVNANTDGVYKLSLKDLVGIPQLFDIWLMDAYRKDSVDMRQNKIYNFDIIKRDSASFGSKRFTLVIRQNPAYTYRLLDFTANRVPNAKQVQVIWKSENEQNYTNFTIEKSIDNGKTFEVMGGAKASGQGTYSMLDKNPIIGQNLYRLKQEDINNTISYSKIVGVSYSDLSNQNIAGNLSIYPNPVMNNVSLSISEKVASSASYKISFMNSSGIMVKQITSAQPSWQGNIGNLQPGIYFIRVYNNKNDAFIGETKFVKL